MRFGFCKPAEVNRTIQIDAHRAIGLGQNDVGDQYLDRRMKLFFSYRYLYPTLIFSRRGIARHIDPEVQIPTHPH